MKTIFRAYKFRLQPIRTQEVLMNKHIGCCRFVYNRFLAIRKEAYLRGEKLNFYSCSSQLPTLKKQEETRWLSEVNSQSLQQALHNLETAYNRFFEKKGKFPKFHRKNRGGSFSVPQGFHIQDKRIKLPKIGKVKIIQHREVTGNIKSCTVSKTPSGDWYASVLVEQEYQSQEKTGKQCGIDTGIKDIATLDDGTKYKNPKWFRKTKRKLQREQRRLSKRIKGSNRQNKQRLVVAKLHQHVANQRKDYLHKITTEIVKNHDTICIEDLAVKNLMRNHRLAGALSEVALGMFYSFLIYKSDWNDRRLIKIDRFFPSSKMCSNCHYIKNDLRLSDRVWVCPKCGTKHDRDTNASKNIKVQGLAWEPCSDPKQKDVEPSRKPIRKKRPRREAAKR